jgi:hypothetical protein
MSWDGEERPLRLLPAGNLLCEKQTPLQNLNASLSAPIPGIHRGNLLGQ